LMLLSFTHAHTYTDKHTHAWAREKALGNSCGCDDPSCRSICKNAIGDNWTVKGCFRICHSQDLHNMPVQICNLCWHSHNKDNTSSNHRLHIHRERIYYPFVTYGIAAAAVLDRCFRGRATLVAQFHSMALRSRATLALHGPRSDFHGTAEHRRR